MQGLVIRVSSKKIISSMIPLIPLFIYYNFPLTSMSFDTVIVFILALYSVSNFFKLGLRLGNCRYYFHLVMWTLTITIIRYIAGNYEVNMGIGLWYIGLVLCLIIAVDDEIFDSKSIINMYAFIAKTVLAIIVIQWFLFLFFGYRANFMFRFLAFNESYSGFLGNGVSSSNFAAFFSERSHAAVYLIPYLCIILWKFLNKQTSIVSPVFVTVVILSTTSGNGIIGCAIAWISFFWFSTNGSKRILSISGVILLGVIAYLIMTKMSLFDSTLNNLFVNNTGNVNSHSKADYRIYRGFLMYEQLPFIEKIFGIGYRCLVSAQSFLGVQDVFRLQGEYMNAIAQILVYTGIIGFVLFALFAICLFKKGNGLVKTLLVCFLAFAVSSSIYFDSTWILYFTLILTIHNDNSIINVMKDAREQYDY